jgi:hypothetical protein
MDFDPTTAKAIGDFDASSAKPAADDESHSGFGTGSAADKLYAALHGAADTATFGMADRASAALAAGLSHATSKPMSYDEAYAKIKENAAKSSGANPVSALIGDAAAWLRAAVRSLPRQKGCGLCPSSAMQPAR